MALTAAAAAAASPSTGHPLHAGDRVRATSSHQASISGGSRKVPSHCLKAAVCGTLI